MAEYRGQAQKWIYPRFGSAKLKDFTAPDADRFFRGLGRVLGKRSLLMIKSTLRRSLRRAQRHGLIGKNVIELVDLPKGQPGRPSRAMTQEQASKVLATSRRAATAGYVEVIRIGEAKTSTSGRIQDATCRLCRTLLSLDETTETRVSLSRPPWCWPLPSGYARANCAH